ncbi:TAXI family TRAP transporter solute-binding subunit [Chloroflexota bacterium]
MIAKRMKMLFGILALFALAGFSVNCGPAEPTQLTIATGGTAGTYFPVGRAMAAVITDYAEGIEATAINSGGSIDNAEIIGDKEAELALMQNDVAYYAQQGLRMFEGQPVADIRGIAALYPEIVQIVTLEEYGIESLGDLEGKTVGIGAPGSGTAVNILQILKAVGLDETNVDIQYLDFGECAAALKEKTIHAGCVEAGIPTSAVTDIASAGDISILEIPDDVYSKLKGDYPFYVPITIPAGTYSGMNEDVDSVAVLAMLVTSADVPEDVIYKATRAIFEHTSVLVAEHERAGDITLETALDGLSVPLHPGAKKYFEEQGLVVPWNARCK